MTGHPMPLSLTIFTVLAAVAMCGVVGHWVERRFGGLDMTIRVSDVIQLWFLRLAGVWIVFWLLVPIVAVGQRSEDDGLTHTNAQQIMLSNQRLASVEARVSSIEAMRLDARLSLLEKMGSQVETMQNWMLGILGGVIVIVVTQILAVLNRPKNRGVH